MYFVGWLLIDKYNMVVVKVEGSIKKYRVIYEQGCYGKIYWFFPCVLFETYLFVNFHI